MSDFHLQIALGSLISAALWLVAPTAHAAAGTRPVAWKGQPVSDTAGWPEGVIDLINDPLRTDGWNPWFSGYPNDVDFYEFKIRNNDDVNHLLKSFAAIKATNVTLRLHPAKQATVLAFMTAVPETNRTAVIFSIGNQEWLNEIHRQVSEAAAGARKPAQLQKKEAPAATTPLIRAVPYQKAPLALPPTLTLYVGHEAIDLKQLKIPDTVTLVSDVRFAEKESQEMIKTIDAFIANRKAKAAKAAPASTEPSREPAPKKP